MTRRRLRRDARADLIWVAVGFIALQVGLSLTSAYWLPELHDPKYAYKASRLRTRLAATAERPVSTVMLGSSRTYFGLRGTVLEDQLGSALGRQVVVYNFGAYGAGPVTELINLRRLLAEDNRPDLLLVEVTPMYLAGQPGALAELDSFSPARVWQKELSTLARFSSHAANVRQAWWEANVVPWYGYRFALVSRVAPRWLPYQLQENFGTGIDNTGWAALPVSRPTPAAYRHALEGVHQQFASDFNGFHLGGPSCAALKELLSVCRKERLPVALVLMPESSDFRSWYPPAARAEINAFVEGLGQEYGSLLIDAREWVADEGFSDGHHLLADGAMTFTTRLGPEVLRMLSPIATAAR